MHSAIRMVLAGGIAVALLAPAAARAADPNLTCHKAVVQGLEKYKKTHLKLYRNCIDKENRGLVPGPCLDAVSQSKLGLTAIKVRDAIVKKCDTTILATLGYRTDCQYGTATPGIGGTCAALPVTTVAEFATCMQCWKGAEFSRYVGTLYASHVQDTCGTALDDTSPTCSEMGCASPLPNQHDLGDGGEYDCQRTVAKAGLNYLLKREKTLDKCLLSGLSYGACLADPKVQLTLAKAEVQKQTLILNKCTNYTPVADPPFCCRTGPGQTCVVPIDRDDCVNNLSGTVQEGKTCNAGSCDNVPGPSKALTWWEHCPTNEPCPGPTLGDIDGVIDCVGDVADGMVGNLLCLQFPNSGTCPTPVATPTPTVTPTP